MFIGEYRHSIDEKGRLIVPAKLREKLGREFIATKGLDKCLYLYPMDEWKNVEDQLREKVMTDPDSRKIVRFFLAGAVPCELDKQGRVLLPAQLREFAGIDKDVVLAGMLTRLEIWDEKNWTEANTVGDMDEMARAMADMGIAI